MISRIFPKWNWAKFDPENAEHKKMLAARLQYFLALPNRFLSPRFAKIESFVKDHQELQGAFAKIQGFSLPSDFPASVLEILQKFHAQMDYDNGYEQIYNIRDFSASRRSGFDVVDVQSGLTFKRIHPGEKIDVYQMSGEKDTCYFDYYGAALGWHRQLIDDEEYWTLEDNAIEFRNKNYYERALVFYALLEAAADAKGCCDQVPANCSDCNADAFSIAKSLNKAATHIFEACKNKGYGINPQTTQLIVLTPLQLSYRVKMALRVTGQHYAGSPTIADFNFSQITTMMLTNKSRIIIALPKAKLLGGYRMDLTLFSEFDILSYTDTLAGWSRYGACIGDIDQIQCLDVPLDSGECPESSGSGYPK